MTDRMVSSAAPLQGAINAALESLARGLALELAPTRVNTVSPGLIETPLWSRMPEKDRAAMYAGAADRLPARSVGQPQDIANAVMFLAATPFATGSNVRVDAGGTIAASKPLSSTPPKRRRQGRRSDTKRPVAA